MPEEAKEYHPPGAPKAWSEQTPRGNAHRRPGCGDRNARALRGRTVAVFPRFAPAAALRYDVDRERGERRPARTEERRTAMPTTPAARIFHDADEIGRAS